MANLRHARSFKDLLVYQRASKVAREVFEISKTFPREEVYSLTDQLKRASRAIGAQIAEAWGKRRYEKYFLSKLTDADAEQMEAEHWLTIAASCGYLTREQEESFLEQFREIGRMLNAMMAKAHLFCRQEIFQLQEATAYFQIDE